MRAIASIEDDTSFKKYWYRSYCGVRETATRHNQTMRFRLPLEPNVPMFVHNRNSRPSIAGPARGISFMPKSYLSKTVIRCYTFVKASSQRFEERYAVIRTASL